MEIPLTQGKVALIDAVDGPLVAGHRWHAVVGRARHGGDYARSFIGGRHVQMHRFLLGVLPGFEVDHLNGDGLDNRRSNLRVATRAQNMRNKSKYRSNTSGFKGVTRQGNRWYARIGVGGSKRRLGGLVSIEDAARAYDSAARDLYGEFARLNFP